MILPDVNVLVYAARDDTSDAVRYREWLEGALAGPEPVALAAPVVAGCRRSGAKAEHVSDAYLAAIAIDLDAELVTADRGFARYAGLRWRHPLHS